MTTTISRNLDGTIRFCCPDIHGNPVERTRDEYPYSYDPHLIWGNACGNHDQGFLFQYSDRVDEIHHLSHTDKKNPIIIEQIFSNILKEPIKLVGIAEGANRSNGYPYLLYGFKKLNPSPSEFNEGLFSI